MYAIESVKGKSKYDELVFDSTNGTKRKHYANPNCIQKACAKTVFFRKIFRKITIFFLYNLFRKKKYKNMDMI